MNEVLSYKNAEILTEEFYKTSKRIYHNLIGNTDDIPRNKNEYINSLDIICKRLIEFYVLSTVGSMKNDKLPVKDKTGFGGGVGLSADQFNTL